MNFGNKDTTDREVLTLRGPTKEVSVKIRLGDWEARGWLGWLIAIPILIIVGIIVIPIIVFVGLVAGGIVLFALALALGIVGLVLLPVLGIPLLILAPILVPIVLVGLVIGVLAGSPILIFLFVAALVYLVYRLWIARR
ncbi:MAG: hypothetical protein NZ930_06610 [Candidatus Bipolaricaulota bacterium]|nr:hypothetical protein [Candidatus Bipolaricaulota bacterium]MDW8031736.1 hypothetical protein [Candidatus Bipolaricaulota bacterium]